ncbi:MAG: tRNA (cytidine(34)-2'-O)-methyltransferase [Oscillospiraceae bacterium]|nr:tRNA (cytidine(34)-2'-O)-methyltransferase [Oscillospiraceae bacterium]
MNINIVLVEPRIPQNVGNIARTAAVTGAKLHLVEPLGFTITDRQLKRAGLDYWHSLDVTTYRDIDKLFATVGEDCFFFTTKAEKTYDKARFTDGCYLFFGREDAGLDESLLSSGRGDNLRIPMINDSRSLNLSNSVAIAVYEALRQNEFSDLRLSSPRGL